MLPRRGSLAVARRGSRGLHGGREPKARGQEEAKYDRGEEGMIVLLRSRREKPGIGSDEPRLRLHYQRRK
jgi:hypothetical protein